jgi:hypothetical protein
MPAILAQPRQAGGQPLHVTRGDQVPVFAVADQGAGASSGTAQRRKPESHSFQVGDAEAFVGGRDNHDLTFGQAGRQIAAGQPAQQGHPTGEPALADQALHPGCVGRIG